MPTSAGPIDNVLLTANGDIAIVEAKLWRNPVARRKVVAQALDYASCLFELSYEQFEARALKGKFAGQKKPRSLYELFADDQEALDEQSFVDAVRRAVPGWSRKVHRARRQLQKHRSRPLPPR